MHDIRMPGEARRWLRLWPLAPAVVIFVGLFAVPGTITHLLLDHVDWRVVAALVVGAVPGARLGAALTIRAAEGPLRTTVSVFLGITAVIYFTGEVIALL